MANATWHEWPTNFSNGTAIDGIGNLFKYMNYVSDGFLSSAFLVIVWLLVFVPFALTGTRRAAASASFVTFAFSVYFWRISMINPVIMFALLLMTILFAIGSKEEGQY